MLSGELTVAPQKITGTIPAFIRSQESGRVALVIGNGIHRYESSAQVNDWCGMIEDLALSHGLDPRPHRGNLSLTELFDLIDLKLEQVEEPKSLTEQFCQPLRFWKDAPHHRSLVSWAQANEAPLLTTNFDTVLAEAVGAPLRDMFQPHGQLKAPTDFYPWEKYFANRSLESPCDGFGMWHINGFINYRRSIRLGLRHYMGSVSRVRPWLSGLKGDAGAAGRDGSQWRGRHSWLDVVFKMPLAFMGLQLGPQEVFLRWLLIERARYFNKYPDARRPAWYFHTARENSQEDAAKYFFLDAIGVTPVEVEDYGSMYDPAV